ncbi:helix-turn-helix transcriptional regulator [Streptomyces sp. JJ38]|uniref:helix-turn-helix domain-containing protein n=1 Tax=Streptomyces sp. JJ38 TaxID=2738128 RepID=UPI00214BC76F|nr:helix-turn-helix transcriptional regulator [Streptomyces sp. JJ38]
MVHRRNGTKNPAATSAAVFGELLRDLRESAHLTQEELACKIPCDRSLVARIEAGTRVPQHTFAVAADHVLGTGGMLERLWQRIDWYPEVAHPDWFKRRAAMDAEAVALRIYGTLVIPGLLQTKEYARAVLRRLVEGEELEELIRARMSRQQRFLAANGRGPLLVAVLDESALHNVVGGTTVMREQCAHLLTAGKLGSVRIQIAPSSDPSINPPDSPMSLIHLPDGQQWVYSESLDRGHFSNNPAVFAAQSQIYDVLRADALSARESAALICDVMEGYGRHEAARTRQRTVDQEQLQRRQRRRLRGNRPRHPRQRPRPGQQGG